jgi:hypothetical protein
VFFRKCAPDDTFTTNTAACYTPKCEVKIDAKSLDTTIVNGTISSPDGGKRDVRIIVKEKTVITAPSVKDCALKISDNFKSTTLINYGITIGHPEKGGAGGNFDPDLLPSETFDNANLNGSNGKDGGNALCITSDIKNLKINNHGVIKGGRAGGSGGAACYLKEQVGN